MSEREIDRLLNKLNKNNKVCIDYDEVEHQLDEVHTEIALDQKPNKLQTRTTKMHDDINSYVEGV